MSNAPNLLLIIADGMQAETVEDGHVCQTPALDQLRRRGLNFTNAHTTSPTCSPARASLMTGLMPHNHGVLEIEHAHDDDQFVLRTAHPHFAQRLAAAGYRTAYFGKWHIEPTHDVARFGWQEGVVKGAEHVAGLGRGDDGPSLYELDPSLTGYIEGRKGYRRLLHWGVTDTPIEDRYPGLTVVDALRFLESVEDGPSPWCCCVSFSEPNEALVVGREAWQRYDIESLPLPANFRDDMTGRPNIYRREQEIGANIDEAHWRAARGCYFGRITEVDELCGRMLDALERQGKLDQTVVVFLSDHGRYVGAHGFDAHNFGGFEEIYRIPLIIAGPGVAVGETPAAVSIADLAPTLCELGGATLTTTDSRSLVRLLQGPGGVDEFRTGYAEYHGTRFPLMQRVLWQDGWKLVFNGFDYDELYHLEADPAELHNLADLPEHRERLERMMAEIWRKVRDTGDRTIHQSHYFSLRFACVGPDAADN
ncbi:MAG: sulfatase-like hydrolase/transferase [Planctomycetales bacterium]|nr:sulfatase-like hydrolase/transferase [Planctomycetales bacterium]